MKIFGCPKCRFFVGVGHQIHFGGVCAPWFALGGSRKISRVANRAILGMLLGVGGAKPPQFVIVWPCGGLGAWANIFGAPWGVVGPLGALWCTAGEQNGNFPHSQLPRGGVVVLVAASEMLRVGMTIYSAPQPRHLHRFHLQRYLHRFTAIYTDLQPFTPI